MHPFAVKTEDNFVDKNDHTCLVMKYYPRGDFMNFLKVNENIMNEKEILRYLAIMIMSIHYLNSRQIYHMDIKFQNILIDIRNQDKIYLNLCDFGISVDKKMPHDLILDRYKDSPAGTANYLSPERIHGADFPFEKQDIWALGVCGYYLSARVFPFDDENMMNYKII